MPTAPKRCGPRAKNSSAKSSTNRRPAPPDLSSLAKRGRWIATRSGAGRRGRTYTIRALRPYTDEIDVDFVLHGVNGPASRWATDARPGDTLQIIAPNRAFAGDPGGYEWRPPAKLEDLLLRGDETALPAIAGILEELAARPNPPRTQAFLEVPQDADRIALPTWRGFDVHWHVHHHANQGAFLCNAATRARLPELAFAAEPVLADIDVDKAILWETAAPPSGNTFYAWIAAEAAAVKTIRRVLLKDRGLPKDSATLMGYWRLRMALDER